MVGDTNKHSVSSCFKSREQSFQVFLSFSRRNMSSLSFSSGFCEI